MLCVIFISLLESHVEVFTNQSTETFVQNKTRCFNTRWKPSWKVRKCDFCEWFLNNMTILYNRISVGNKELFQSIIFIILVKLYNPKSQNWNKLFCVFITYFYLLDLKLAFFYHFFFVFVYICWLHYWLRFTSVNFLFLFSDSICKKYTLRIIGEGQLGQLEVDYHTITSPENVHDFRFLIFFLRIFTHWFSLLLFLPWTRKFPKISLRKSSRWMVFEGSLYVGFPRLIIYLWKTNILYLYTVQ